MFGAVFLERNEAVTSFLLLLRLLLLLLFILSLLKLLVSLGSMIGRERSSRLIAFVSSLLSSSFFSLSPFFHFRK